MKKCLYLAVALLLALSVCLTASADKLDDVTVCVGGSYEEQYSSTGAYIGKAAVADKSIVKAELTGTSLTISNRFYYGTTVTFTGLKPGKTTVNFYSDYGGWMGSVTVIVKDHEYKERPVVLTAVTENGERFYRAEKVRSCARCGDSHSEYLWLDGAEHGDCTQFSYKEHTYQKRYDDMETIRQRLKELGYAPETYAAKGNQYDAAAGDYLKLLSVSLGGKKSTTVPGELIAILLSSYAPAYEEGFVCPAYTDLSEDGEGENVTALQERLCALGYLPEENLSGVYDEYTVFAVKLLQIDMGYDTIDGNASQLLQAALFRADDSHRLTAEEYAGRYARLAACIGEPCADVYVVVTQGSNVRSAASYSGTQLLWVNPGDELLLLDEADGWYKVQLPDGREGYLPMDRSQIKE